MCGIAANPQIYISETVFKHECNLLVGPPSTANFLARMRLGLNRDGCTSGGPLQIVHRGE